MSELNYSKLQEYLALADRELNRLVSRAMSNVNAQKTTGEALDHYQEQELAICEIISYVSYAMITTDNLAKKHQDFMEKYGD